MEKNLKNKNNNEESFTKPLAENNELENNLNNHMNNNINIEVVDKQKEIKNINANIEKLKIEDEPIPSKKKEYHNISKVSVKTQYKIYIPFTTIKILIPTFFMYKYLIYGIKNKEDQNYCKYAIIIFHFYILILYYLAVISKSSQTKVDKYFSQNIYTYKTGSPGSEILNMNPFQWNNCLFCKSKKFERSSHCRICNKCILMRDHHCPYIANCVGFHNLQYFFNFVFWINIGNFLYIYLFIYYMFFSGVKTHIHIFFHILLYVDLLVNMFFIFNFNAILIRSLVTVYNNWTQKETISGPIVENYCPIHPCCRNDKKLAGEKREVNYYNIGFLSHFYYLVGPTILHFLFPIPKYKNYILDENCPIFKEVYEPTRLDIFRHMVKTDPDKIQLLIGGNSSPDNYIQLCHQYYDNKKII